MAVIRMSRDFASTISASCFSCLRISAPCSCCSSCVEHFQQPRVASSRLKPLSWCSVCRCKIEQFGQFFVAAIGVLDLARPACAALPSTIFSCLRTLLGLLLDRVLALVEQAFALVQLLADLAEFVLPGGLLLDGQLFDFQLGFAFEIRRLALGLLDDFVGFGLRVAAAEAIEQLDQDKRQNRGHNGRHNHRNYFGHGNTSLQALSARAPSAAMPTTGDDRLNRKIVTGRTDWASERECLRPDVRIPARRALQAEAVTNCLASTGHCGLGGGEKPPRPPPDPAHVNRRGERRRRGGRPRREFHDAMPPAQPEGGLALLPQTGATCTQPKRSAAIERTSRRCEPVCSPPDRQMPLAVAELPGRMPWSQRQMKINRFVILGPPKWSGLN